MTHYRKMITLLRFLLCLSLMGFASLLFSQSNVLFILDGSGSMWQKLDGEFKISVAKSVLKDLIDKLPDQTRVGLIAYGHHHKSDCNDIETITKLSLLDKISFTTRLDGINPQGKTPIAKSIHHALDLIKNEQAKVTIILVSDGLETCEGNACDLVQQARAKGVQITVHVVGFGIDDKDFSALECIAQVGNGRYIPVNNASELSEALFQTVEEGPKNGGYLSVKVTLDGQPVDAIVKAYKKGETKAFSAGRTFTGPATNPRLLLLPAGDYTAEVLGITIEGAPIQLLTDLKIVENDTLRRTVDYEQGIIEVLATRNGELSDATVQIWAPGVKNAVATGRTYRGAKSNPALYKMLPGTYDVELSFIEISGVPKFRFEKLTLEPGKTIALKHDHPSGTLKVGARQGEALVDAVVTVFSKALDINVASGRTYVSSSSNPKSIILEPGMYRVDLKPVKPAGLGIKSFEVEIKAGESVEHWGNW